MKKTSIMHKDIGKQIIDDIVEVVVEADEEKKALASAKQIIKRKHYRVFKVYELPDANIHDEMQMKGLEIQAEALKHLKKHL